MSSDLDSQTRKILLDSDLSAVEKQNHIWGNRVVLCVEELVEFGVVDPSDIECMLDMIFNEIRLREPLNPEHYVFIEREYANRFPALQRELQQHFSYERELSRITLDSESPLGPRISDFDIVIPGYSITDKIGSGGFGTVYKARQLDLNRTVAIKVLGINEIQTKSPFHDFRHEAMKASRLFHKNIVEIYDIVEHPEFFFVIMPFVEGGSLRNNRERLKNRFDEIATIVADISRAVQYAHDLSILHCDITPNNILFGTDQRPMLVDFGLSIDKNELSVIRGVYNALNQCVDRDSIEDSSSNSSVSLGGTYGYMSPEQSSGDLGSLSEKTDIFSLGAVLFFLITGKEYREDLTVKENWESVDKQNYPPIDLVSICSKCLSNKTEDRYRTAEEIAQDLEKFIRNEIVIARPLRGIRNAPERISKWMKRSPAVATWSLSAIFLGSMLFTTLIISFFIVTRESYELTKTLKQSAVTAFDLGKLAASNGTVQQAIESYRKAISVQERLVALFPDEAEYCLMLAKTKSNLAISLSEVPDQIGPPLQFQQAIQLLSTKKPPGHLHIEWFDQLGNIHENYGNYLRRCYKTKESLNQYKIADRVRKSIYSVVSPDSVFSDAKSLMSFAGLKSLDVESLPDAVQDYRVAIEKLKQLEAIHYAPDDVTEKLQIANMNLANTLSLTGQASEALIILGETKDKWESMVRYDPENHKARRHLAISLTNYGNELSRQGNYQKAISILKHARDHYVEVMQSEKIGFFTEVYYGTCLNFLSGTYRVLAQKEYQMDVKKELLRECKLYADESVKLMSGIVDRNKFSDEAKGRLVDAYQNLANYYLLLGDFDSSIESHKEALRILEESDDPTVHGGYQRIAIVNDLARALIDHPKSRLEEARQLLKKGLEEGYELVHGVEGNSRINSLLQVLHDALGLADFKEGFTASDPIIMKERYRSGISNFSQSIEIGEKSKSSGLLSDDYLRILHETYGRRAGLYELTGEYGASILDWRVLIEQGDPKNPDHLLYRLSLATVLAKNGEVKTAWDEIRSIESVLPSNVIAPFMAACCLCEIYRHFRFNSEGVDNYFTSNDALLRQILAHLESADGLGYFDTPTGLASLQSDPSLLPIRDADEFVAFIDRIVAKSRAPKSVLDPSK